MVSEMPPIATDTFAEAPPIVPATQGTQCNSNEEAVLLFILRLLNRTAHRNVLTPVERAFVEGARTMFQHLAVTCDTLLTTTETERQLYASDTSVESAMTSVGPSKRSTRRKSKQK